MITGSIVFLLWRGLAAILSTKGYYRSIYTLLILTIPFWVVPFLYVYIWSVTHQYDFRTNTMEIYRNVFEPTERIAQIESFVAMIWLIGAVMVVMIHLLSYYRLEQSILQRSIAANPTIQTSAVQIQSKLKLTRSVSILECYGLDSAIIVGVISPKIILPSKSYTPKELEAILHHELIHAQQHILLWKLIASFMEDIYWFNPISYWLSRELDRWSEVDCDIKACFECKGCYGIREYFWVALELAQTGVDSVQNQKIAQTTLFGKTNYLKERIKKVKNYSRDKKELSKVVVAGLAAVLCLGSAGTAYAAGIGVQNVSEQAYDSTVVEQQDNSTVVQLEDGVTEYTEPYDENAQPVVVHDLAPTARSGVNIDWSIAKGALHRTSYFSLKEGDNVSIILLISPSNKKVRVGLITPTNTKRYIVATDQAHYTFNVDEDGKYGIFVENASDVTVQVTGTAIY